jgi:hypothetical protein
MKPLLVNADGRLDDVSLEEIYIYISESFLYGKAYRAIIRCPTKDHRERIVSLFKDYASLWINRMRDTYDIEIGVKSPNPYMYPRIQAWSPPSWNTGGSDPQRSDAV